MTDAPSPKLAQPKPKRPLGLTEALAVALAVNMIATGCLTYRVYKGDRPKIVTVGVGQLTREYVSRLATSPNMSPSEVETRTKLFMAIAQDAVKNASSDKGVIIMPRECVLAGEYADATEIVGKAVSARLEKDLPLKPAAAPPRAGAAAPALPLVAP